MSLYYYHILHFINKSIINICGSVLQPENEIDEKYYLSERAIAGIIKKKERMKVEGKGFGAQILNLDKPSYTIPARYFKDGYDALVQYSSDRIRRLTILELKRIQTFEDNYILCGTNKDQIMQIGNAVACNFAYHIAKHIANILHQLDSPSIRFSQNLKVVLNWE